MKLCKNLEYLNLAETLLFFYYDGSALRSKYLWVIFDKDLFFSKNPADRKTSQRPRKNVLILVSKTP